MTTAEACDYLRITRRTLARWATIEAINYHTGPGGRRRYHRADLDAAMHAFGGQPHA